MLSINQLKVLITFHSMPSFTVLFPDSNWEKEYDEMIEWGLITAINTEDKLPKETQSFTVTDKARQLVDELLMSTEELLDFLDEVDQTKVETGYDVYYGEEVPVQSDEQE